MITTEKLGLYKFGENDDIEESLVKLGENMDKLDASYEEKIADVNSDLIVGRTYPVAYKVWNKFPSVGSSLGWVNIRDGVHVKKWVPNKSYSVGDKVAPLVDNGHYYECMYNGVSNSVAPDFLTTSGSIVQDRKGTSLWQPVYNYEVGDLVVARNGETFFFYKCTVAGMSNSSEPNWVKSTGSSTYDGSVVWIAIKTVYWKEVGRSCNFRPFGIVE